MGTGKVLKRRLIPKLLLRRSTREPTRMVLVTTIRFEAALEIGDPVSQARIYQAQAADELIFLDIDATRDDRGTLIDVVRSAAEEIFMPITVGGGVRSIEDIRLLLANGADKVSINTAALEHPELISAAADEFGAQCVVVSIDYTRNSSGGYVVHSPHDVLNHLHTPVEWAIEAQRLGAGEILLTSVDRDGTRQGLDVVATRQVVDALDVPVVTSGGCGAASHFVAGFAEGRADGVSAGTYFSMKDENPMQTRSQIANSGIPIRLHT